MERALLRIALLRIAVALAMLMGVSYGVDDLAVRYQIPGGRPQFGKIDRNVLYVIHVKGGEIHYEPGPPQTDTCVHSLFPHFGDMPCWYVQRHPDKLIEI